MRDFYDRGMTFDAHKYENSNLAANYLGKIDAVKNAADLPQMFGRLHRIGTCGPWRVAIDADDMDSSRHILRLTQAKLTLPDRDYYLDQSDKMKSIREKYREHIQQMYNYF